MQEVVQACPIWQWEEDRALEIKKRVSELSCLLITPTARFQAHPHSPTSQAITGAALSKSIWQSCGCSPASCTDGDGNVVPARSGTAAAHRGSTSGQSKGTPALGQSWSAHPNTPSQAHQLPAPCSCGDSRGKGVVGPAKQDRPDVAAKRAACKVAQQDPTSQGEP